MFGMKNAFNGLLDRLRLSYERVGQPKRVLAALSGGADSTALLLLLSRLASERGFTVLAAHVNHGLRSTADRDERFAASLCASLSIPFSVKRLVLPAADEATARNARYDALCRIARDQDCSHIALAHHRNDQAETLLMRLIRGSVEGLGGMREDTPQKHARLWRPLLSEDPMELRAFLRAENAKWVEDESNQNDQYLRNFLRLSILPALEERQASTVAHIARAAAILREESDFLDAFADQCLHGHAHFGRVCPFVETAALDAQPPAIRRRMIRLFLLGHNVAPECAHLAAAIAMADGDTVNLPGDARLVRTQGRLHLVTKSAIPAPFQLERAAFSGFGDGKRRQVMPRALFWQSTLRYREPGDRIVPFGMKQEKSLQDYLVDRKVPSPFRDALPLLCQGKRVYWVIGVGCSEECRAKEGERIIRMRYCGYLPGIADYQSYGG